MRVIYFDNINLEQNAAIFRSGTAQWFDLATNESIDTTSSTFHISPQVYQAFLTFAVLDKLQELPHIGMLRDYEEGILVPAALPRAAVIFRTAANSLVSGSMEVVCGHQMQPERIEYRLVLNQEEVQQSLQKLASFVDEAYQREFSVQLWL